MPELMPAIFFGHGNPMNAVMTNGYTEAWHRIGGETRKPRAILGVPSGLLLLEGFTYASNIGTMNYGTQNLFANTAWHYADNVTIIHRDGLTDP
jgi:hypothetical protein